MSENTNYLINRKEIDKIQHDLEILKRNSVTCPDTVDAAENINNILSKLVVIR